jgi:hypothetical protein
MATKNELKGEIERLESRVSELRADLSQANDLADEMREHVEDASHLIENWIEVFDMDLDDDDLWIFDPNQSRLWEAHKTLREEHSKLIRDWNKFAADYNSVVAPRSLGRPLQASDAQVKDVRKLRKKGVSLRRIAAETGLGLRTVRTVVEKDEGTGRTSKQTNLFRKRELDRLRAAEYRARKRGRDRLPKEINKTLKRGKELVKAAKGLGDG